MANTNKAIFFPTQEGDAAGSYYDNIYEYSESVIGAKHRVTNRRDRVC